MGHTRRDDVAQTSPMEELAHDLLATDNRSCGSLGPTTGRSSSTASGHGDRGERHAHIVARHGRFQCAEGGVSVVASDGAIEGQSPAQILQTRHRMLHELQKKPNRNK